ncbi:phospho-N-acetylmuramoyl-pentapeptide-transferase [Rickettsia endosymbiont of Cardiosporidium cionae]|uniref:phospho-N-acetylmuramoyl-pentapeptide- transferase n=1 Tax=Rickettsia endosymbiont of Cardiosporidium cionae TaxID=2777155 RepID=UPI001893ED2D|nr:phospho-N-acetylmuramoyl-pentapeptide-transferase [Rickettsia endosymbiont of Cardiosporidium cionae]KAF8818979.1 phospho-N-acetylmuramoyl-pentapeptide-transferase [Rickettsia endosymbiont of Cardiosporidium cionae]
MFYNLLFDEHIVFRTIIVIILNFIISMFAYPVFIFFIKKSKYYKQPIRLDGPSTHLIKSDTPTMGGIILIFIINFSLILFADLTNIYIWLLIFTSIGFAALGFYDDYSKVKLNTHRGISVKQKLSLQILLAILIMIICFYTKEHTIFTTNVKIAFINYVIDLKYFYPILGVFIIVGSSNSMNLVDGLDGLSIGITMIIITSFMFIIYYHYNSGLFDFIEDNLIQIKNIKEVIIACAAIIGAGLGFLWYNSNPAQIFMGDTGSLALGGIIGTIVIVTKNEFLLLIVGALLVIESISVILQVYYYKLTKKRLFLMAPIHHHFEKLGWAENKIVIRFFIFSIILSLVAQLAFY